VKRAARLIESGHHGVNGVGPKNTSCEKGMPLAMGAPAIGKTRNEAARAAGLSATLCSSWMLLHFFQTGESVITTCPRRLDL
jgi:hypothetical protein